MTALQQARANARLEEKIRESDGQVFTKRAWIERKLASGYKPIVIQVSDPTTVAKLEKELAYLRTQWEPSGNPNWPPTKRFYAIKQELADGPTKPEYRLVHTDGRIFTITKTEYDYANTKA